MQNNKTPASIPQMRGYDLKIKETPVLGPEGLPIATTAQIQLNGLPLDHIMQYAIVRNPSTNQPMLQLTLLLKSINDSPLHVLTGPLGIA